MSRCTRGRIFWRWVLRGTTALILLDVAGTPMEEAYAAGASGRPTVAIVRSDYEDLPERVPPDATLTETHVEAMVREACRLAGIEGAVRPEHRWIVIKPNIVELKERGSGVITDWRVVKALIKIVHEIAPRARITIAEGGAWVPPERKGVLKRVLGGRIGDGFEIAGYRQLLTNEELADIALDIVDLNFDKAVKTSVPDGGYTRDRYFIPRTIRECDVLIDVPVLKVIQKVGMTNAMKNFIGIAPGMVYGWGKSEGYPPGSGNPGIPHSAPVLDETIVELTALSGVDFVVVDAIIGMERHKTDDADAGGVPVRMNMVVAGRDVVATDAVSARLIGLNPDDLEYVTLGSRKGLGICDLDRIEVIGEELAKVIRRLEKPTVVWGGWGERGHYGQSNRIWLLKGPFPTKAWAQEFIDPTDPRASAGENGWSQPLYFHDDKIDLDTYYGDPADCVVYAYAEFTAPKSQNAELWVGSDEGLGIWINGDEVYTFEGARRHHLPNDKVEIPIREGTNTLLVKAGQTRGKCDFSINLCELEEDERYDGNRVFGLKFSVPTGEKPGVAGATDITTEDREDYDFGDLTVVNRIGGKDPLAAGESAPRKKMLKGFPRLCEGLDHRTAVWSTDYIAALQAVLSYRGEQVALPYLMGVSGEAFRFCYDRGASQSMKAFSPTNPLQIACDALGYTYAYSYNDEQDDAWTRLKGWISMGYPVMVDNFGWGVLVGYAENRQKVYLRLHHGRYRGKSFFERVSMWLTSRFGTSPVRKTTDLFLKHWRGRWPGGTNRVGNPQFVVGDKVRTPDPRDVAVASLQRAVELATNGDIVQEEENWTRIIPGGFRAYRCWWEYLQREVRYEEGERWDLLIFEYFLLLMPIRTRGAAADHLDQIAEYFGAEDRVRLAGASAHYRALVDRLSEAQKILSQVLRQEMARRRGGLAVEDTARFVDRPRIAQRVREAYLEEHEAIRLLGEIVDMPVPELENWVSAEEEIARGRKLFHWECLHFDGVDDLLVRGKEIRVKHLQGTPPKGIRHTFLQELPNKEGYHLIVKWLEGRGDITVVQQPNAENNYAACIRIDDSWYEGADMYRFEVYLVPER